MFKTKRVYTSAEKADGIRILVDRLWPRGVNKEKAEISLWFKDIAPSNELRKWFSHKPQRWGEFKTKYFEELKTKKELVGYLQDIERKYKTVTFLYAARDEKRNNATALVEFLKKCVVSTSLRRKRLTCSNTFLR